MAVQSGPVELIAYEVRYCSGRKTQEPVNPDEVHKRLHNGEGWISERWEHL
jgi:hypothetical protein